MSTSWYKSPHGQDSSGKTATTIPSGNCLPDEIRLELSPDAIARLTKYIPESERSRCARASKTHIGQVKHILGNLGVAVGEQFLCVPHVYFDLGKLSPHSQRARGSQS